MSSFHSHTGRSAVLTLIGILFSTAGIIASPTDTIGGTPDHDWATYQNNQQRSGRTEATLGAANCDLTAIWTFADSINGCYYAGPIIKDGKVVQAFYDRYRIFDLATGAILHEIETGGDQVYCTPAILPVTIDGAEVDVLFVADGMYDMGGGIAAYLWNDIASGPIWTSQDPGGCGETRYGGFTILNDAGQDVLFFERGETSVHAVYAATGEIYPGWGGEVFRQLGFGCGYRITSLTTDGVRLFISVATNGFPGDIYAINAFTLAEEWRLSTAGGLQAVALFSLASSDEGFEAGLSYDFLNNTLFAHSAVTGTYPADGVFYALDPQTGALKWVTAGNRVANGTPVIGNNLVHVPTFTRWLDPPGGANMVTYGKYDGVTMWVANHSPLARFPKEAILTTGYGADPDLLIALDESGRLHFLDGDLGETVMSRQVRQHASRQNYGMCAAIEDTLVVSTYYGTVTVLAGSAAPLPRLQIEKPRVHAEVSLSAESEVIIPFEDVVTNAGCADLNITFIADELSNGTYDPSFSGSLFAKADSLAKAGAAPLTGGKPIPVDPATDARPAMTSSSQASPPPYVIDASWGDVVVAGDTKDLLIRINPSLMSRGVYSFYVQLDSDDPDFFINDTSLIPEIFVQISYGCQLDTTTLHFGVGGANEQLVSNTGRLGSREWEDGLAGHNGFLFDSQGREYYQGGFIYGVTKHRLAMNSRDWVLYLDPEPGAGEFRSLMPDPNYIDGDCKPAVQTQVTVPDWTTDGITYHSFDASAVYSSFVDSVQLFYDYLGNWDWSAVGDPFQGQYDNDSTFGTITHSRTIGVTDAPAGAGLDYLNHGTIQVLEIASRNGATISGLGIGHFFDHDLAVVDTVYLNRDISAAWACGYHEGNALGVVKIPFGVGYEPLYNMVGMHGYSGFWNFLYWDSAYMYMHTNNAELYVQPNPMMDPDEESHVTLLHDATLGPADTIRFAQVVFRLEEALDWRSSASPDILALAHMFNKFAGFGRGDVNNDNRCNLTDLTVMVNYLFVDGAGPIPYAHLSDVNASGESNLTDLNYLVNYLFLGGPPPLGDWEI